MKHTGHIIDSARDFRTGSIRVTLQFDEPVLAAELDDLISRDRLNVELKPWRKQRSKEANAYCWTLIGELAAACRVPPVDIYRELIRDVGGNYVVQACQDEDVDLMRELWEAKGLGWLTDTFPSKIKGCTNVRYFRGSSTYDTMQMSRLIDLVVQACKDAGIDPGTPEERALLLDDWRGYQSKKK